jgi:hypothetical protein
MHLEFLVEELSAEALLNGLLPKLLPAGITWKIHAFQGKRDLLANLTKRLKGYRPWLPEHWRVVVLVDSDRDDCRVLKQKLEQAVLNASLGRTSGPRRVLNRVAVTEIEAWYLGDVPALVEAFPRVDPNLAKKERYRNPDAVAGGTWEALERVLRKAGHFAGGLEKIALAQRMAPRMDPNRNRSNSFRAFVSGLRQLYGNSANDFHVPDRAATPSIGGGPADVLDPKQR